MRSSILSDNMEDVDECPPLSPVGGDAREAN